MQILSGKLTAKQEFIGEIWLGRALTKTFLHITFVVTPYGFMIPFGEWALRERCSRTHPPNYIMSDAGASLCQQKEKHKKTQGSGLQEPPVCVCFVFSDYGRVLCTNKRLYVRLSRTGSRKT